MGSSIAEGASINFLLPDLFTAVLAATSFLDKMRANAAIRRDLTVIEKSVLPQIAGVVCGISEGLVADFAHMDALGLPVYQAVSICRALEWENAKCYPILP